MGEHQADDLYSCIARVVLVGHRVVTRDLLSEVTLASVAEWCLQEVPRVFTKVHKEQGFQDLGRYSNTEHSEDANINPD